MIKEIKALVRRDGQSHAGAADASRQPARKTALRRSRTARRVRFLCGVCTCFIVPVLLPLQAQQTGTDPTESIEISASDARSELAARVDVEPIVEDDDIKQRLTEILESTNWYVAPMVTVRNGIVYLKGTAYDSASKKWAGDLARNTEGVIAVVNQMELAPTAVWNFDPTFQVLNDLARGLVRALPLIVVALAIIALSWTVSRLTVHFLRRRLVDRTSSQLLLEVMARAGGILVMLVGLYLVLRIAGLTQLALTLVGGTGLIGLVLGIAFRDITENFLASLFLSLQQPFREGDLVDVANVTGYVQRLTARTTVLMTLDGNQIQVPNSTVFKSTLRNFTSNPNRREDFLVGIGYDDSIPAAQEVALKVLADHPAVLREPEPLVLVENLGSSTVNLRVYFWIDGAQHSWLKVKSSVIRFVKRAFQDAGISLPDEAREVTFPNGVPVRIMEGELAEKSDQARRPKRSGEPEAVSTRAEAGLASEAEEIKKQARSSWTPGQNLLTDKNESSGD